MIYTSQLISDDYIFIFIHSYAAHCIWIFLRIWAICPTQNLWAPHIPTTCAYWCLECVAFSLRHAQFGQWVWLESHLKLPVRGWLPLTVFLLKLLNDWSVSLMAFLGPRYMYIQDESCQRHPLRPLTAKRAASIGCSQNYWPWRCFFVSHPFLLASAVSCKDLRFGVRFYGQTTFPENFLVVFHIFWWFAEEAIVKKMLWGLVDFTGWCFKWENVLLIVHFCVRNVTNNCFYESLGA